MVSWPSVVIWVIGLGGSAATQSATHVGEQRTFGADPTNTNFSPLNQIGAANLADLEIGWRRTSVAIEATNRRAEIPSEVFTVAPSEHPTTNLHDGTQYIVVTVCGGRYTEQEMVARTLPVD